MCWPDSSEIESSSLHNSIAACVLLRVYLRATGRGYGILNLTYLSDVVIATSQSKKFAFFWLSPNQYDRFIKVKDGKNFQKWTKGVCHFWAKTQKSTEKRSQSLSYINWSLLAVKNKIKNLKYTFSLANNFSSFFFFWFFCS